MKNSTRKQDPETVSGSVDSSDSVTDGKLVEIRDVLSQILREGAQKMLQTAIRK